MAFSPTKPILSIGNTNTYTINGVKVSLISNTNEAIYSNYNNRYYTILKSSNYEKEIGVKMYKINKLGFRETQTVENDAWMQMSKQGWKVEEKNTFKKKKRK